MGRLQDVHLVVLQHGMWGTPADLAFVEEALKRSTDQRRVIVLNSGCNTDRLTYDGIDVLGDRLASLVTSYCARLQAGKRVVRAVSFMSYSLGGLIARYAIGKLAATGFFTCSPPASSPPTQSTSPAAQPGHAVGRPTTRGTAAQQLGSPILASERSYLPGVVPVNFVTFATPHLSSWSQPDSRYRAAFNAVLPYTLSRTGSQLVLADRFMDGLPLLAIMADPQYAFHAALGLFQKRLLLANVRHDATVPFTTSSITHINPYERDPGQAVSSRYPCVVVPTTGAPKGLTSGLAHTGPSSRGSRKGHSAAGTARRTQLTSSHASSGSTPHRGHHRNHGGGSMPPGPLPVGRTPPLACTPWLQSGGSMPALAHRSPAASCVMQLLAASLQPVSRLLVRGSGPASTRSSALTWGRAAAGQVHSLSWQQEAAPDSAVQARLQGQLSEWLRSPQAVGSDGIQPSACADASSGSSRENSNDWVRPAPLVAVQGGSSGKDVGGWWSRASSNARRGGERLRNAARGTGLDSSWWDTLLRGGSGMDRTGWVRDAAQDRRAVVASGRGDGQWKRPGEARASWLAAVIGGSGSGQGTTSSNRRQVAHHSTAPRAAEPDLLPARSSRLRGEVFAAMLPLLVVMWACMLLWLLVLSAHHYLLLLCVRKDSSWNVKWQATRLPAQPALQLQMQQLLPPALVPVQQQKQEAEDHTSVAQRQRLPSLGTVPVGSAPTQRVHSGSGHMSPLPCVQPSATAVQQPPGDGAARVDRTEPAMGLSSPPPSHDAPNSGHPAPHATPGVYHFRADCRLAPAAMCIAATGSADHTAPALSSPALPRQLSVSTFAAAPSARTATALWGWPLPGWLCRYNWPLTRLCLRLCAAWWGWLYLLLARACQQLASSWWSWLSEVWEAQLPSLAGADMLTSTLTPQQPPADGGSNDSNASHSGSGGSGSGSSGGDSTGPGSPTSPATPASEPAGGSSGLVSAGSSMRQAQQQRLMCEQLNLLQWHRADVDTRHYHAHAAIVVRSAARFSASHGHVVEYAIRQMRDM